MSLRAGETLEVDQPLYSQSGQYRLIYQGDGNLVMYNENDEALWSSDTYGADVGRVSMDGDGSLRMYDSNGGVIWETGACNPDTEPLLAVQDDGNLVIYVNDWNDVVWTR